MSWRNNFFSISFSFYYYLINCLLSLIGDWRKQSEKVQIWARFLNLLIRMYHAVIGAYVCLPLVLLVCPHNNAAAAIISICPTPLFLLLSFRLAITPVQICRPIHPCHQPYHCRLFAVHHWRPLHHPRRQRCFHYTNTLFGPLLPIKK